MNRYTIFADVAGRLSLDASGSDRMTAAAVTVSSTEVDWLRQNVRELPKWRDCNVAEAEAATKLISSHAVSLAVITMTKEPEAWNRFWKAAKPLQDAIVAQDRFPAGFIKPANVVLFSLVGQAFALALAHAIKITRTTGLLDYRGKELIERTIVCDSDIQGDENIAVFKAFWERSDQNQPLTEKLGIRFITRSVKVMTEQEEPLLLLSDYAAGIGHSAFIPNPGRLPLPVAHEAAKGLLKALNNSGKLAILAKPFDVNYEEIFGEALLAAEKPRAC